jgi:hypothetical protein
MGLYVAFAPLGSLMYVSFLAVLPCHMHTASTLVLAFAVQAVSHAPGQHPCPRVCRASRVTCTRPAPLSSRLPCKPRAHVSSRCNRRCAGTTECSRRAARRARVGNKSGYPTAYTRLRPHPGAGRFLDLVVAHSHVRCTSMRGRVHRTRR